MYYFENKAAVLTLFPDSVTSCKWLFHALSAGNDSFGQIRYLLNRAEFIEP